MRTEDVTLTIKETEYLPPKFIKLRKGRHGIKIEFIKNGYEPTGFVTVTKDQARKLIVELQKLVE